MIRFFSLFAVILCLFAAPALAQEDAYDEYLNGKKKSNGERTTKNSSSDWRNRYLQDAGASYYWFDVNTVFGPASIALPAVHYTGRLIVKERGDRYSMSLGTAPSLGLQFGNFASYFMLSVPVLLEANIGLGSSLNNQNAVGAFVGLGPEFNLVRSWGEFALPIRFEQLGAVVSAGIRFRIRERGYYIRYGEAVWTPVQGGYFRTIAFGNALF